MRNTFAEAFYNAGLEDDRLTMIVADISPAGSIQKFADDFPNRFINTGVAEQIMIGICAGMALRGLRPFAYTIATFTIFRPYEFVRDDLCYQNLPVTIVGIGGGVSYSTLGGTHNAIEDIALGCALPNMQVIAPSDSIEVREATRWCTKENANPCYLRLSRVGDEPLSATALDPWRFGKVRYLRKGDDVCVLTYGATLKMAMQVADALTGRGESVSLATLSTIKPLDRAGVVDLMKRHKRLVIIEEAVPSGSLGAAIKQVAWEVKANCEVHSFSLQDAFIHVYGSHDDVLAAHGLSPNRILAAL
jgi:transketolase